MGEKAQDGGGRARRLPGAGAVVAMGAVVGLAVASPVAFAVAGGDDDETVEAVAEATTTTAEETTTTSTTIPTTTTTAAPVLPEGPFAVVLTVTSAEPAEAEDVCAPGEVVPGTTLTCTADACQLDLVFGPLVQSIPLVRTATEVTGQFRWDIGQPECAPTGTVTGDGTVALAGDGTNYRGAVTIASDEQGAVQTSGGTCLGSTFVLDLAATRS